MNTSFDRFKLLFLKQWAEDRRLYLLSLLVIALAQLTVMLLLVFTSDRGLWGGAVNSMGIIGLILSGSLFASILLNRFRHKSEAIFAFMLPASAGEKVAVAVVYGLLLFPLTYYLLFFLNLSIAGLVDMQVAKGPGSSASVLLRDVVMTIQFFWLSQAFVLLCSLLFRKRAFMIASAAILLFTVFVTASGGGIMTTMIGKQLPKMENLNIFPGYEVVGAQQDNLNPFSEATYALEIKLNNAPDSPRRLVYTKVELPASRLLLFNGVLLISIILLLYIVWFKLKEQQL
jgi:hypothetical protein